MWNALIRLEHELPQACQACVPLRADFRIQPETSSSGSGTSE